MTGFNFIYSKMYNVTQDSQQLHLINFIEYSENNIHFLLFAHHISFLLLSNLCMLIFWI